MGRSTEIRLAKVRDAAHLAVMSRDLVEHGLGWSWTAPRIARHVRSPESVVLVAECDARIAGFAIMRFGDEEAHLDLLAVKPRYRRLGIARWLVEWLEQSALVAGVSVIYLEVRAGNSGALSFYEKLGFQPVKRLPGYYSGRESAVCMGIDLWCSRTSTAT